MQISKSKPNRFLFLCLAIIATLFSAPALAAQTKRHLGPDDFYRMRKSATRKSLPTANGSPTPSPP